MQRIRRLLLRVAIAPAAIVCAITHASAQQVALSPSVMAAGAASMSRNGIGLAATIGQPVIGITAPGAMVGQWGFWHAPNPYPAVSVVELARAADARLAVRLAPNPASGQVRLELAMHRPGNVRVRLIDLAGNVVALVAEGTFEGGSRRLEIPLAGLPSGSYIVELLHEGMRTSCVLVVLQ